VLADVAKAPLAIEAVRRIDAIFDIEREINGLPAAQRAAARRAQVAPLVAELERWMRGERGKLSRHADVAKAMDYMLKRWEAFARFLDDGRICLTNNAAERELRRVALGRKSWLFAGSDEGAPYCPSRYVPTNQEHFGEDFEAPVAGCGGSRPRALPPWMRDRCVGQSTAHFCRAGELAEARC
jgi:hypothetical protein